MVEISGPSCRGLRNLSRVLGPAYYNQSIMYPQNPTVNSRKLEHQDPKSLYKRKGKSSTNPPKPMFQLSGTPYILSIKAPHYPYLEALLT